jgi:hypothetical protein
LESSDSPNIYITSPTATTTSRFPPPLSMNFSSQSLHSLHSISSPNSSPTQADFPVHPIPSLSRQHSFQHVSYRTENAASATPLPPSPGSGTMDLYDGHDGAERQQKRQRTSSGQGPNSLGAGAGGGAGVNLNDSSSSGTLPASAVNGTNAKKMSRARSDSAPLGYGLGMGVGIASGPWHSGTRPRSGSGMAPQRMGMGVPNIGSLARGAAPPLLSIPTLQGNGGGSPSR